MKRWIPIVQKYRLHKSLWGKAVEGGRNMFLFYFIAPVGICISGINLQYSMYASLLVLTQQLYILTVFYASFFHVHYFRCLSFNQLFVVIFKQTVTKLAISCTTFLLHVQFIIWSLLLYFCSKCPTLYVLYQRYLCKYYYLMTP